MRRAKENFIRHSMEIL